MSRKQLTVGLALPAFPVSQVEIKIARLPIFRNNMTARLNNVTDDELS